jgi:autotransporter-associated beta strand protein
VKSSIHPFRTPVISGATVLFACFSMLNPSAQAADQVWIGSTVDHNVTTPGNWGSWVSEGDTCASWSPFVFGSGVVDGTVNLNRWVAINSITLTSGLTHDITIDNGPIVMGGSLVDMSSAGANLTLNAQVQQGWGDMTFNVGAGRTLTAAGGVAESGWFGLHTGLTKNGAGTAVIKGASTYTLDTYINAGTLEIGGAGTLGVGGSYAGTIINYGAFVHSSSEDQTLAAISGSGSITQSGTGTLSLTSYGVGNTGTITVNSGTLRAPDGPWQQESHHIVVNGGTFSTSDGNSRALSWTLNGGTVSSRGDASPGFWGNIMLYDGQAVTVGGAAVSTISSHVMLGAGSEFAVGAGSTLNVTGAVSNSVWATGNGSFIKTGDGTMALTATNNYTGTTAVNEGKLIVNGNISTSVTTVASGATIGGSGTVGALTINSGGFVTPGNSPGILTVNGNYSQAGQYTAEIAGTTAGSGYDQINVLGTVDISGGSLVTAFSGSYAQNDLLFILLNDGTDAINGTFAGYAQGATVASYGYMDWQISYTANSVNNTFTGGNDIAIMAVPEPNTSLLIGSIGVLALLRRRR